MDQRSIRHDWTRAELTELYEQPLFELLDHARSVHRAAFPKDHVQLSTLLNIKSGGCPEDCKYCAQSIRYDTGLQTETLLPLSEVKTAAAKAKAAGASRFCMGAAWRQVRDRDLPYLCELVATVKAEGLETCMTLGMLNEHQAGELASAGLDYYNHNLDTSPEYYPQVISTRSYADRLATLAEVQNAGMKVCCGGIIGMGETAADRMALIHTLATLEPHPGSVPINLLVPVAGTPMAEQTPLDHFELVRTIAVARISMPKAYVRLSAGRMHLDAATQTLCFYAGANSVFYGERLLTTDNNDADADQQLFSKLGLAVC